MVKISVTTMEESGGDAVSMSMGLGYVGGVIFLVTVLASSLYIWYRDTRTVSIHSINTTSSEIFYWLTIMFSQTLGTALGDWTADTAGFGCAGSMYIYSSLLVILMLAYFLPKYQRRYFSVGIYINASAWCGCWRFY
ncbi:hypothetical protein ACX9P6_004742 [Citrobacter braakii]